MKYFSVDLCGREQCEDSRQEGLSPGCGVQQGAKPLNPRALGQQPPALAGLWKGSRNTQAGRALN